MDKTRTLLCWVAAAALVCFAWAAAAAAETDEKPAEQGGKPRAAKPTDEGAPPAERSDEKAAKDEQARPDPKAEEGQAKKAAPEGGEEPAKKPEAKEGEKPTTKEGPKGDKKGDKKPPKRKEESGIPPDDPWLQSQAARLTLKQQVVGPPLRNSDLYGQVVLIVYYQSNKKDSKRLVAELARMDQQYRRRGLVVIGASRLREVVETPPFAVYSDVEVPDTDWQKLAKLKPPFGYVLDHRGKVVYQGPLSGRMIGAVRACLGRRPHPAVGEGKFPKSGAIISRIRAGRVGDAIALCKKAQSQEGEAAREAQTLLAGIDRYAKRRLARAKSLRKKHPRYAHACLLAVKKEFAGSAYGDEADAELKDLLSDKAFQNEVKADRECKGLIRALSRIDKFPQRGKDSHKRMWIQRYGQTVRAAKARLRKLSEKYPGTSAVRQAEALLDERWPTR